MLAARTTRISSSPTMKGLIAAERLRAAGVDVVDLSAGEPDFPDARARQGRGARRHRGQLHQVHAELRIQRGQAGDPRPLSRRLRRRVRRERSHRLRRRQAGTAQCGAGRVRPGRRSHHAHARVADARRADQAGRCHAGHRPHVAGGRLRAARAAVPRRDHAAHQGDRHQLAGQSDRRADDRGGDDRRLPTRRPRVASGSSSTSATRS